MKNWIENMPSQMTMELLDELRKQAAENAKPAWWNAIDRFGLPVVGWVFVGVLIWYWGGKWFDAKLEDDRVTRESRQQEREQIGSFLSAQTEAMLRQTEYLNKIVSEIPKERAFESQVIDVHEEQAESLRTIADTAKDTNVGLKACQQQMSVVPSQREESLTLLKEIRDGLKDGT